MRGISGAIIIEYMGQAGSVLSVPALKRSEVVDLETGELTYATSERVSAGELRRVAENVGLALLEQGHYMAHSHAVVEIARPIADGKTRVHVAVVARRPDGRLLTDGADVRIAADGARVSSEQAFRADAGVYAAHVTARKPGSVLITGTVDGVPFVPCTIEFLPVETQPAEAETPVVDAAAVASEPASS